MNRWIFFFGTIFGSAMGAAAPLQDNQYPLDHLERSIQAFEQQQVVVGYELGEVNWSQRTIQTLGAGTHMILSPTGGWGQESLETLAIERARQNIERLSVEVFRHRLEISRCAWGARSRMFNSPTPLWLSDGTIHLSAMIRFEMFEDCETNSGSPIKVLTLDHNAMLERMQLIESSIRKHERMIVSLKLSSDRQERENLACLQSAPEIYELSRSEPLPNQWRAVRWFWSAPTSSTSLSLIKQIEPSLSLGSAKCEQSEGQPKLRLLNAALRESLDQALSSSGGAELWIWIDR